MHARRGYIATQLSKLVPRFVQIEVCVEKNIFALKHFFSLFLLLRIRKFTQHSTAKNKVYKANIFVGLPPRIFLRLILAPQNENSIESDYSSAQLFIITYKLD